MLQSMMLVTGFGFDVVWLSWLRLMMFVTHLCCMTSTGFRFVFAELSMMVIVHMMSNGIRRLRADGVA